jgi:Cof subfamily protein (haloacid dehalogenase superfamily)
MNSQIKLIMIDLDGTLLNRESRITPETLRVLQGLQHDGLIITLASGRTYTSMLPYALELGGEAPLASYNGAWIRQPRGSQETLIHHTLPEPTARQALEILRHRGLHANVYINDELIVEDNNDYIREYGFSKRVKYRIVSSFDSLSPFNPTKILAIDNDTEKIARIRDELSERTDAEIFRSSAVFCEILPAGIDKGWALDFFCDHFGINPAEVIAFGDQENDINMLKKAGIGVAMANALDSVKEAANTLAPAHHEDGVARFLMEYFKL